MSANPNYKPSEGKREEFRKYLEKTGVMDALTKVLVSLYEEPEKPEHAIEYICNKLAMQVCGETLTDIKINLDEANAKIIALEQEVAVLKAPPTEEPPTEESAPVEGEEPPAAE